MAIGSNPSILIIGPQKYFVGNLQKLRSLCVNKYSMNVIVTSAESIRDQVQRLKTLSHDMIIITVDTMQTHFKEKLIADLKAIPPEYLISRTILVNGCCGTCSFDAALNFKQIANLFHINFLNSNIEVNESCDNLLEILIELLGYTTGISLENPAILPTSAIISTVDKHFI